MVRETDERVRWARWRLDYDLKGLPIPATRPSQPPELYYGVAGAGLLLLMIFILPFATAEVARLFTAENVRPYRFISAAGSASIAIHAFMTGTVKVPIRVSPTSGTTATTFTITLASATQSGFTYDIQRKVGSGSFATWRTGVTTRTFTFRGSAGTYAFRSRLHRTSNGATSGYSPAKTITVS